MHPCIPMIIVVTLSLRVQAGTAKRRGYLVHEDASDKLMKTDTSSLPYQDMDRRYLVDLKEMIEQKTGRSAFDYLSYGCYCGLGGSGSPVDDIDRCCQSHDNCYSGLYKTPYNCWLLSFNNYKWSTTPKNEVVCDSDQKLCDSKLCDCDRLFVECIERKQYNDRYHGLGWTFSKLWKC